MKQSVESNSFKMFKATASLPIICQYFRLLFFLKKDFRFLRKSSKPRHENLVLITSSVQAELSKLNFNFDCTITNFPRLMVFCAMMTLDRTRTEQNRTDLILTIKIYKSSFI